MHNYFVTDLASVHPTDTLRASKKGGNGSGSQLAQYSSLIGIITAIIGNILISFALNTQRYAHIRIDREYHEGKGTSKEDEDNGNRLRGYGTTEQEQRAEELARKNAQNDYGNHNEDDRQAMQDSFQSDDTLRSTEKEDDDDNGRESYLKSPYWWAGIIMMTIGEAGNFLAYGFAPASIVSPLGVVALISNCLIAPLMLKERFRKRDLWGVLIAVAGAVTVVLSAKQNEQKMGPDDLWSNIKRWEFLVYVLITVIVTVGLMYISPRYGQRTILIDLGLVGLFGGYTALSTKGVASLLSGSLYKAFTFPITYFLILVLILSAIMQIRYINRALQNFDSTQVIPTQFVLFTLSVIIGSAVLYRDFESTTLDRAIKFIAGCLLTFFGVYLITSGRRDGDQEDADDSDDQEETIRLIDEEANHVDERTPLKREASQASHEDQLDVPLTPNQDMISIPRPSSRASSSVPSIAVTPAQTSEDLYGKPWAASADNVESLTAQPANQPQTPKISRAQSDSDVTPFFTPSTSRLTARRMPSSPADPMTPTRKRHPSPPKVATTTNSQPLFSPSTNPPSTLRAARGSIGRLLPGPLLPPLSSSLSAVVADSIRRGEGTSRLSLRRRKSKAPGRPNGQRRPSAAPDEEAGFTTSPALSRQHTIETVPDEANEDANQNNERDRTRLTSRLRTMSETLTGMIGGSKRGKRREDEGGDEDYRDS